MLDPVETQKCTGIAKVHAPTNRLISSVSETYFMAVVFSCAYSNTFVPQGQVWFNQKQS